LAHPEIRPAAGPGDPPRPLDPPRLAIAQPHKARLPAGHHRAQALDGRRQVHAAILDVRGVDAEEFAPEPGAALVDLRPGALRRQAFGVRRPLARPFGTRPDLRGDDHLAAIATRGQPTAEQQLALGADTTVPELIAVRRVDEGPSGLDVTVEDREGRLLVDLRAEHHR